MRKIASIVLSILIIATLTMTFVQQVRADHYAKVYWAPATDEIGVVIDDYTKGFSGSLGTFNATFAVFNNDTAALAHGVTPHADDIVNVRVVLPRNASGYVYFRFAQGWTLNPDLTAVNGWHADPTEFDPRGWPGTIIFSGLPSGTLLSYNDIYWFRMNFTSAPPSCHYSFTVYTEDQGTSFPSGTGHPKTEIHDLEIVIDNTSPSVTTVPVDGGIVNGTSYACGVHYFNLTVTAHDAVVDPINGQLHDTGISAVNITIDDGAFYYNDSIGTGPGETWTLPSLDSMVWNLASGTYVLKVTVWDGVGNTATVTVTFTYNPPLMPAITVTPTTGTSAKSSWLDSASGLVLSEQITYKQKVLGTSVTVSGVYFDNGVDVTVTVYIPTYTPSEIVVAETTTGSDGSFSTTFVFPQAPAGLYTIWVYSTPCNLSKTFEVIPEVIYKPDEVVGPSLIEVIATGFTAENMTRPSWFFIVPDALQGVNTQVDRWWYINENGTLVNWLNTYTAGVENVSTTLNWPWMEPGTYTVELKHIDGDWWNGTSMTWVRKPCFVGGNIITVDETLSLLISIKADTAYIRTSTDTITATLNQLSPVITSINDTVVTLSTTVGTVQATLDQLSPVITSINNNVVTLNTTVGQINTTMATIGPQLATIAPDIATIKTSVGTGLNGTVTSIQGDVATITTDVGNINGQLPTLTNYTLVAVIFSVIAAIAAIACAFLVYRKIA